MKKIFETNAIIVDEKYEGLSLQTKDKKSTIYQFSRSFLPNEAKIIEGKVYDAFFNILNPAPPCGDIEIDSSYEESILESKKIVEGWKKANNENVPPAYKIKITIELESISDEEEIKELIKII